MDLTDIIITTILFTIIEIISMTIKKDIFEKMGNQIYYFEKETIVE